jgi:hypothetical protein
MAHARWRCVSRFSLGEHGPRTYRGSDFLNSNLMSTASAAVSGAAKLLAAIAPTVTELRGLRRPRLSRRNVSALDASDHSPGPFGKAGDRRVEGQVRGRRTAR